MNIANPVTLTFDPTKLTDDDAEFEGGVPLREVFADDIARTYWMAIKSTHITNQYFRNDCLFVAAQVRRHIRRDNHEQEQWTPAERLRSILSCTQMFHLGAGLTDQVEALLPYMTGERTLKYVVRVEANARMVNDDATTRNPRCICGPFPGYHGREYCDPKCAHCNTLAAEYTKYRERQRRVTTAARS